MLENVFHSFCINQETIFEKKYSSSFCWDFVSLDRSNCWAWSWAVPRQFAWHFQLNNLDIGILKGAWYMHREFCRYVEFNILLTSQGSPMLQRRTKDIPVARSHHCIWWQDQTARLKENHHPEEASKLPDAALTLERLTLPAMQVSQTFSYIRLESNLEATTISNKLLRLRLREGTYRGEVCDVVGSHAIGLG